MLLLLLMVMMVVVVAVLSMIQQLRIMDISQFQLNDDELNNYILLRIILCFATALTIS